MKAYIKKNSLVVKLGIFETSYLYFLPILSLPFLSESHYEYIHMFAILGLMCFYLWYQSIEEPVLYINDQVIIFRKFAKVSHFNGFLTHEGMEIKPLNCQKIAFLKLYLSIPICFYINIKSVLLFL